MSSPQTTGSLPGQPVDKVSLEIDYQIIEHFSKYLYGSPNKAIEELVANSFDAFATEVHVFFRSQYVSEKVIVWDDGSSMDVGGLKALWQIANSPKNAEPSRINRGPSSERKMIGKFGIGKLASYTLGDRIVHLCRRGHEFLLVAVDYDEVRKAIVSESGQRISYSSPIQRMSAADAETLARGYFSKAPLDFDSMFSKASWTLAVIDRLKPFELSSGRLMWILGNGMPLRPDFAVTVNGEKVIPKLDRAGAAAEWNFDSNDLVEALRARWSDAKKKGNVSGELEFSKGKGLDPRNSTRDVPYVQFPSLGVVWGVVRLFSESLEIGRQADQGRSSGFFVMVRGRLINPENDKILLPEPSFGTFYRSQFILHIDELDQDLLADRERLQSDTARSRELLVLQSTVYHLARTRQEQEQNTESGELSGQKPYFLPTHSRRYFRDPIASLLRRDSSDDGGVFDLESLHVIRKDLGEKGPVASFSAASQTFEVNNLHPYFQNLRSRFGDGKRAAEIYKQYEALAVGERLFEGYLYDAGFSEERVREIVSWREEMYRQIAFANDHSPVQIARKLEEASYSSGAKFENAIVDALNSIGFVSARDGASGKKDIGLRAPCGSKTYTLVVEAKGKQRGEGLKNDDAEVSGAAAHRDAAKADWAVIVARKFAGFDRTGSDEKPAVLQECEATGRVSILEVEALKRLIFLMHRFTYGLDYIRDVFVVVEAPQKKLERIQALERPLETFDYRRVLTHIWGKQNQLTKGKLVSYGNFCDELDIDMTEEEFNARIGALATLAFPLIEHDQPKQKIALRQEPSKIADAIDRAVRGVLDDS